MMVTEGLGTETAASRLAPNHHPRTTPPDNSATEANVPESRAQGTRLAAEATRSGLGFTTPLPLSAAGEPETCDLSSCKPMALNIAGSSSPASRKSGAHHIRAVR